MLDVCVVTDPVGSYNPDVMRGKVVLITGANSGIGKAVALGLARMEATVVMACRTHERGEKAVRAIKKAAGHDDIHLLVADLSTTDAIHQLADEFKARFSRLDVLVNNAAVLTSRRKLTSDGFEMQFFVNHLAYFLLTGLLIDTLQSSAPSRIVNIASTAHSGGVIDFENLQGEGRYRGWKMYANTKLANVMFTYELARRLQGTRVTANCVHPGVIHTNLLRNFSRVINAIFHMSQVFFKQPDEGADTPIYLASSPEVEGVSGKYFKYRKTLGTSEASYDEAVQQRLWQMSEQLTGFKSTF